MHLSKFILNNQDCLLLHPTWKVNCASLAVTPVGFQCQCFPSGEKKKEMTNNKLLYGLLSSLIKLCFSNNHQLPEVQEQYDLNVALYFKMSYVSVFGVSKGQILKPFTEDCGSLTMTDTRKPLILKKCF